MKNVLRICLAIVLLLNVTDHVNAGSVEMDGFSKLPPICATNGSAVYMATDQSRIEIHGSSALRDDTVLKYAVFGCISVLVGAVALSCFTSPRIIVGGIQGDNISVTNGSQLSVSECGNVQLSNVKVTNGSSISIGNSSFNLGKLFSWPWQLSNTISSDKKPTGYYAIE